MLKISIVDTKSRRRLVVEGKLVAPWAAELTSVWRKAIADPDGRNVRDLCEVPNGHHRGRRKRTS